MTLSLYEHAEILQIIARLISQCVTYVAANSGCAFKALDNQMIDSGHYLKRKSIFVLIYPFVCLSIHLPGCVFVNPPPCLSGVCQFVSVNLSSQFLYDMSGGVVFFFFSNQPTHCSLPSKVLQRCLDAEITTGSKDVI